MNAADNTPNNQLHPKFQSFLESLLLNELPGVAGWYSHLSNLMERQVILGLEKSLFCVDEVLTSRNLVPTME